MGVAAAAVLVVASLALAGLLPGFPRSPTPASTGPPEYDVTFVATGLAPGTSWTVTVHGTAVTARVTTITFEESNGSYPYSITPIEGLESNLSSGSVTVHGANLSLPVTFDPALTAGISASPAPTEIGVAAGLSVDVTGGFAPVVWTLQENGSRTNVTGVSDGQYRFAPSAAAVYTFYLNATDAIGTKSGSTTSVDVEPALKANLTAYPTIVSVNESTNLSISFSGGVPGVRWTLEQNGSSTNLSGVVGGVYPFTPRALGVYTFYLNGTDAVGGVARATVNISCANGSLTPYSFEMIEQLSEEPTAGTYWIELAQEPSTGLTTAILGLRVTTAASEVVPPAAPPSDCAVGSTFGTTTCGPAVAASSEWYAVLVYPNETVADVYGSAGWTGPTLALNGGQTLVIVSGAALDGIGDVLAAFSTSSTAVVSGSVDL